MNLYVNDISVITSEQIFILQKNQSILKVNLTVQMKPSEKGKDSEKEKGLGILLLSFATSTTAHGLNRIAGSADFRIRLAWFVVWLGVVIGFVVMVFNLATLYISKPTSTSINVDYKEV